MDKEFGKDTDINSHEDNSREDEREEKKKGFIFLIIFIFLVVGGLIFTGVKLYGLYKMYHTSREKQITVAKLFHGDSINTEVDCALGSVEISTENNELNGYTLEPLISENSDVVGWIRVEDTIIDFPIMKTDDQEDFYFQRDFDKNYDVCGTPFMATANTVGGKRQNYIIYGHNMSDGSVFAELKKYLEEEFRKEHPTFILVLREGDEDVTYDCEIFSIEQTLYTEKRWVPYFVLESEMQEYIDTVIESSVFEFDVEKVTFLNNIVTLSTCDRSIYGASGRYLVHARLVKRGSVPVFSTGMNPQVKN